jgi:hypothetical protein
VYAPRRSQKGRRADEEYHRRKTGEIAIHWRNQRLLQIGAVGLQLCFRSKETFLGD